MTYIHYMARLVQFNTLLKQQVVTSLKVIYLKYHTQCFHACA